MERPAIKKLYYRKRCFGSNAIMRTKMKEIEKQLLMTWELLEILETSDSHEDKEDLEMLSMMELQLLSTYMDIRYLPAEYNIPLPAIPRKNVAINSFADHEYMALFRFRSQFQLYRLFRGFQFPEEFRLHNGIIFSGEEVFLAGLYRLCHINLFGDDGWQSIFGWLQSRSSLAFKVFMNFMLTNWTRLIENHFHFWADKLAHYSDCIRMKLEQLSNSEITSSYLPGGFNVFGFIDNTCVETCRPGGGPTQDGTNLPRNDPMIQRAFYNGWKKHHGIKFQTVDLPNGMNYNIWGSCSLRHNDIWTFYNSNIHHKLVQSQLQYELKFKIYGDSAYMVITEDLLAYRYSNPTTDQVAMNKHMSSCRECIEWNYNDVFRYFNMLQDSSKLKLRKMDIEGMFKVACIFRNAHVTMNGNITSEFFNCTPPTFEVWISQ